MFEELKKILTEELEVDPALVVPEAEFVNDLKLNSLEIADFIVMCEEKFGAEIEEEDIHSILTVQDLCDYIASHA
jgi:acyl carrier protein